MDHYGVTNKGAFIHETVETLPAWTSSDEGREIYVSSESKFYKGTNSQWILSSPEIRRRNAIINGNFSVWQRGQIGFGDVMDRDYFADRFHFEQNLVGTSAWHSTNCITLTPSAGFPFNFAMGSDVGFAVDPPLANNNVSICHHIEGYDILPFTGNTATLSFWVKSIKTGIFCVSFRTRVGKTYVSEYTINSSNTWEKKTITLSFNDSGRLDYTTGVGLCIRWVIMCGTTRQTNTKDTWQDAVYYATPNQVNGFDSAFNNFCLTGVQFEVGETASDFEYRSYAEELLMCQRYYRREVAANGTNSPIWLGVGYVSSANTAYIADYFPVPMRVAPIFSSNGSFEAVNFTAGGLSIDWNATSPRVGVVIVSGSGGVTGAVTAVKGRPAGGFEYEWDAEMDPT